MRTRDSRCLGLGPERPESISDLGVYYAECLWCRRTKLKWIVLRAPGSGVASHLISGLPGGKLFDPISWMRVHCSNVRASKNSVNKMNSIEPWELRAESFYRKVLSDAPPGRRVERHTPTRANCEVGTNSRATMPWARLKAQHPAILPQRRGLVSSSFNVEEKRTGSRPTDGRVWALSGTGCST